MNRDQLVLNENFIEERSLEQNSNTCKSDYNSFNIEIILKNFRYFLKHYNKFKDRKMIPKKIISKKNKLKKRHQQKKNDKKNSPSSQKEEENLQIENSLQQIYNMLKQNDFKEEEIKKIILYMRNHNFENINESLLKKFPKLLQTLINMKKKENINYIETRNSDNFLTYLNEVYKGEYYTVPSNCNHVKICYYIWNKQGNEGKDPTAIGRKIKKMALFNQAEFEQQEDYQN